ncbi:MAG: 2-phospho-L-lactate guanylyltransferase [Jatrophihabitans sp.]
MRWTVVIPVKALPAAKSRLAAMTADAQAHRALVEAIRQDTVAAAIGDGVARVLLVSDSESVETRSDTPVLVQSSPGLNAALREAATHAAQRWPADGVAALVGDLPALRREELAAALALASELPTAFVADADGTGTTLLTAVPGHELQPAFGTGSAARHGRSATSLPAGPGLRRDVDTAEDLRAAAAELGVGPATANILLGLGVTVRTPCVGMMEP